MSRRAVVLAGGRGTRLRPYTAVLPKPLMPVGDYSILEIILRQLASFGFNRVTLAVNHQAEIIRAFCGDGARWGMQLDYSLEDRPLSTVGPLKLIHDLPENFILMNGDVLTDLDLSRLYEQHVEAGRMFTIAASPRKQLIDYGVLETDGNNRLTGFQEKPSLEYLVSMGIYVMNRQALDAVPHGEKYGFDHLMLDFLKRGQAVHVEPWQGYWLDIGRVDDYMRAVDEFESMRGQLIRDGG
jgi:NDP-sugar pyrophosphorylase family protein